MISNHSIRFALKAYNVDIYLLIIQKIVNEKITTIIIIVAISTVAIIVLLWVSFMEILFSIGSVNDTDEIVDAKYVPENNICRSLN